MQHTFKLGDFVRVINSVSDSPLYIVISLRKEVGVVEIKSNGELCNMFYFGSYSQFKDAGLTDFEKACYNIQVEERCLTSFV